MFKNVKEWYLSTYPSDELGEEINPDITFKNVFEALYHHRSIYETISVYDSIVRERVFEELSTIIGVDYDFIYEQWLLSAIK